MHPKQREYEQRDDVSTLIVTVEDGSEFHDTVRGDLQALERGDTAAVNGTPVLSFTDHDQLLQTFTPRTLDLLTAIRQEQPSSINETARVVNRDVKNVHDELARLEKLGVIHFEQDGQAKRPIVWFDELDIRLSISEGNDSAESARAD